MSKITKTVEYAAPKVKKASEVAKPDAPTSAAAKPIETLSNDVKPEAALLSATKSKLASPIAERASGGKSAASKAKTAIAPMPSTPSGAQTANVDPKQSKPVALKAVPAKAAKATPVSAATAAKPKTTKLEQVLILLSQKGGTTIHEVMKATGWQKHSVRGFFAGTVRKKLGFELTTEVDNGEERRYAIKVAA